ncbi:uncharacterized protein LOC110604810 [Manihot esculenta]|uniref:uncharacterized protein LOC110604810 n=1 Tax=Manihot esculenta TaxID=3983 RepID=UPI000B5D0FC0|nr:uncharacterized protein LOC110604810 [Manihot esculenta]
MASKDYCPVPPLVFTGENYQSWVVKMTAYLQSWDLWEVEDEDLEIDQLPDNQTMQQIKTHKEKTTKKFKAKTCLYSAVSESLFTRIMNLETAFHIWKCLKTEFQGIAHTKSMCILNLRRALELQKMKDSATVKEYVDRLLDIINKLKLLGENIPDSRIVEKILVTLPERFEAKIYALKEVRDLAEISLAKLLNALHAQEQRRQIREDGSIEGAMQAKLQLKDSWKNKKKKGNKSKDNPGVGVGSISFLGASNNGATGNKGRKYHPCQHCGRTNHPHFRCWSRPDAKCNTRNQMGHIDKICKNKGKQIVNEAQAVNQEEEE